MLAPIVTMINGICSNTVDLMEQLFIQVHD